MLNKWIEFFLTRRAMVLVGFFVFIGAGVVAFALLNIEAYPNPAPTILEISAQAPGLSAEEMERYYSIPIEVGIATTPGLEYLRSISFYGLSFVRAQFHYGVDYYFALQQTLNRLGIISPLTGGVTPNINPSSLVGEVYRYQLVGPPGMSAMDLRTLNDWVVARRFKTVAGVEAVTSWGGPTREYHVEVDLNKLPAYRLTMAQVIAAIGNANINVGGRTLDVGQQSVDVRGIGLITTTKDIDNVVITQVNGIPVLVKDIGKSVIGYTPRQGIAGKDGDDDVVLGIVVMRRTEKTSEVVAAIKTEADNINAHYLPKDVHLVPYYDRAQLVKVTTETVVHNLIFGICLVFLIQYLFLGNLRSAIVVAATIPFALFFAVIIMVVSGESANLLSIGAVDFGIIVDSTVIMVENIFRALRVSAHPDAIAESRRRETLFKHLSGKLSKILGASVEVNGAILFAVLVTVAAFTPLFTMQGIEGQIFGPMARTYGFALLGALICTFTVSPALSAYLLPEQTRETETWAVRGIRELHMPALRWAMDHRAVTVGSATALLAVAIGFLAPRLGTEFLPHLEEGNLWIRVALPPTISLNAGEPIVHKIREILDSYPEVQTVVSQHGRPDDGSDAAPISNAEFFVPLKPESEWPRGMTKDKLIADMQANFERQIVGATIAFSQYIQDNIEEAVSGVKGANSVKLFGPDLEVLDRKINEIKDQMVQVKGITDVGIFKEVGKPNLLIEVDREKAARYGLETGDVNAIVSSALNGAQATAVFEGEKQFALVVRLDPKYRATIEDIRKIQVADTSTGGDPAYVPLSAVANISLRSGAAYIYREAGARFVPMKFDVRGRDLGSAVEEAQERVAENVHLPEGYRIVWSGEFGAYLEAQKRLAIIVPLSLLLILALLYALFNRIQDALLALTGLPFAMCGGIIALFITGQHFSVSSAVGFVTAFGINAMDGILIMQYYNTLHARGLRGKEAMIQAARLRMRPILMTSISAAIGLLPAALSTGIGSQVQRPLATVVVGSMLFVPIMNLIVVPVVRTLFLSREDRHEAPEASPPPSGNP